VIAGLVGVPTFRPQHQDAPMPQTSAAKAPALASNAKHDVNLAPAQQAALASLKEAVRTAPFVMMEGAPGAGKTLLLQRLIAEEGGHYISGRDITLATTHSANTCTDEQLHTLIEEALSKHDLVVIDDFDAVTALGFRSAGNRRPKYLGVVMRTLIDRARALGKRLVIAGESFWVSPEYHLVPDWQARACNLEMPPMQARDFAFFFSLVLGESSAIDADRIYQYAPSLNAYHLMQIARLAQENGDVSEAALRELIDTRILRSNLRGEEIASITFDDLKGFEGIIDKLTTYLINPLQQDARFDALQLKPKRGVLLYGPPGTGKTSIGRALARQMRGKFFMIDGTIPPEPAAEFFRRIKQVFEAAKSATPSVIFIDDADVLFQSDRSTSLSRYLLTMLDGLESATAGKVAVIMTAMDPNHMPAALLRSGRVELWLETKPPAAATRAEMVAAHVTGLPGAFRNYDAKRLTELTEGFNAADMRRIVADVKALYAADVIERREPQNADTYFEIATRNVRRNKDLLSLAEVGAFSFGAAEASNGRSEAEKKKSRLRDESNQCAGE
jgi:ATP-dependent 26S proteasome regulatory subunit